MVVQYAAGVAGVNSPIGDGNRTAPVEAITRALAHEPAD
jgi:hypothetical protein